MKLTKITLAALVGALSIVGGLGIGIGVGAGIWSSKTIRNSNLPLILVTDGGTITDKSFNEQAYDALSDIYGVSFSLLKKQKTQVYLRPNSTDASDIVATYAIAELSLADDGIILAPGFYHQPAITKYQRANTNSKIKFIVLDGVPRWEKWKYEKGKKPKLIDSYNMKNTIGITFDTKQAGFKAGYLSGLYLQEMGDATPTVGLWGGGDFPGVTDFMVGYVAGIAYYNSNNGTNKTDVKFATFNSDKEYVNSGFNAGGGKLKAQHLLNKSVQKDNTADILLAVAGPQTEDAIKAMDENANKDKIKVIGVDTDQSKKYPKDSKKFLTSIMKNVHKAAVEGVKYLSGLPTLLLEPSKGNFDPSSKHFHVGMKNGFTSYAQQYDKSEKISKKISDSKTWGELYTSVDNAKSHIAFKLNNRNITLKDATWNDALAYIKKHAGTKIET